MTSDSHYQWDNYLKGWYTENVYGHYLNGISAWLVKNFSPNYVLDVGCARGYLVKSFREMGVNSFGIDISADAIKSSPTSVTKYLTRVDITKEKLPFDSATFDLVTCLETLEHLPSVGFTMSEIKRVLKPNKGYLFMSTPTKITEMLLWRPIFKLDPTHCNLQSRNYWKTNFLQHGLEYLGEIPRRELNSLSYLIVPSSTSGRILKRFHLYHLICRFRQLPIFKCMSIYRCLPTIGEI